MKLGESEERRKGDKSLFDEVDGIKDRMDKELAHFVEILKPRKGTREALDKNPLIRKFLNSPKINENDQVAKNGEITYEMIKTFYDRLILNEIPPIDCQDSWWLYPDQIESLKDTNPLLYNEVQRALEKYHSQEACIARAAKYPISRQGE